MEKGWSVSCKRQAVTNPNTIFSTKRLIGRKFAKKDEIGTLPFSVVEENRLLQSIEIEGNQTFMPEQISSSLGQTQV